MEALETWIVKDLDRAADTSRTVIFLGGFLVVSGLIGRLVVLADSFGTFARSSRPLMKIWPEGTTFWVPETLVGYAVAAGVLATGLLLAQRVNHYSRLLG